MMFIRATPRRTLRALLFLLAMAPAVPASGAEPEPAAPAPAAPAPETQPAPGAPVAPGQVFASWATAGLFRLEALRYAAAEAPLEGLTRQKLIERVRQARGEVDAISARYAAGSVRSAAARKAVDEVLARLGRDADALLGARSSAFDKRVEKIMGEAQLFAARDPANAALLLDATVKPTKEQKAKIDPILSDASARVKEIQAADKPDALAVKHEIGFATRSAVRGLLTAEQQKAFDGPFEAPAAASSPTAAATADATAGAPAAPAGSAGASEARAVVLARLEAMRYAALEGPFPAEAKVNLTQRIRKARTDVLESATGAGGGDAARADGRISRVYTEVLADASKVLGARADEFIRRQDRIYQDATELAGDGRWPGRAALEVLKLTAAQRGQVDQILSRRDEQLKALVATTAPGSGEPAALADERAALSLRRREVAFQARAALRAVLTPEQQQAWDAANP